MCLTCKYKELTKDEKEKIFYDLVSKVYFRGYNNSCIQLSKKQIDEIVNHALYVVVTGVDLSLDVWAIQWPRDYKVKNPI